MEPIAPHGEELLKMGGLMVGLGTLATLAGISAAPGRASYLDCTRHAVATPPRPCDPGTAGEGVAAPRAGLIRSTYRSAPSDSPRSTASLRLARACFFLYTAPCVSSTCGASSTGVTNMEIVD